MMNWPVIIYCHTNTLESLDYTLPTQQLNIGLHNLLFIVAYYTMHHKESSVICDVVSRGVLAAVFHCRTVCVQTLLPICILNLYIIPYHNMMKSFVIYETQSSHPRCLCHWSDMSLDNQNCMQCLKNAVYLQLIVCVFIVPYEYDRRLLRSNVSIV